MAFYGSQQNCFFNSFLREHTTHTHSSREEQKRKAQKTQVRWLERCFWTLGMPSCPVNFTALLPFALTTAGLTPTAAALHRCLWTTSSGQAAPLFHSLKALQATIQSIVWFSPGALIMPRNHVDLDKTGSPAFPDEILHCLSEARMLLSGITQSVHPSALGHSGGLAQMETWDSRSWNQDCREKYQ